MNVTHNGGVVYQVWSELDITRLCFAIKLLSELTLVRRVS